MRRAFIFINLLMAIGIILQREPVKPVQPVVIQSAIVAPATNSFAEADGVKGAHSGIRPEKKDAYPAHSNLRKPT